MLMFSTTGRSLYADPPHSSIACDSEVRVGVEPSRLYRFSAVEVKCIGATVAASVFAPSIGRGQRHGTRVTVLKATSLC